MGQSKGKCDMEALLGFRKKRVRGKKREEEMEVDE